MGVRAIAPASPIVFIQDTPTATLLGEQQKSLLLGEQITVRYRFQRLSDTDILCEECKSSTLQSHQGQFTRELDTFAYLVGCIHADYEAEAHGLTTE